MRRVTLTASSLWRASRCIGSAVLPRTPEISPWSERGTVIHAFLMDVNRIGRDAALLRLKDDTQREACALLNLSRLPVDPAAYRSEVAFAIDVVTGRARALHDKGDRDYTMCAPTEIPMTVDVVALVDDDAVVVKDYKTGHRYLEPPALTWQMRACGTAVARAYGRHRALVDFVRLGKDGEPFVIPGELDLFDMAQVAEDLRELHADATRSAAADVEPRVVAGSHCTGCECIADCKAQRALAAMARRPDGDVVAAPDIEEIARKFEERLTPETAAEGWEFLEAYDNLGKALWKILDRFAGFTPFKLKDGRTYGPVEEERDTIDGRVAWKHLADRYGAETAWRFTKLTIAKTGKQGLETLADELAKKSGEKRAPVMRRLLDDLRRDGALKTFTFEKTRAHRPKESR